MSKITSLSAKDQGKTVFRLIKYTSPYKGIIALAFLMLTLATVTSMLTPYLIKVFIDDFLTPNNFPQNKLILLVGFFIGIQIIGAIATYINDYMFQYLAFKVIQQLRIDAFNKLGSLGMRYFDKVSGGSIVSRLTNDTETIVNMFIGVFSTVIMAVFMMISSYIMMFILDVQLALYAIILCQLLYVY